MNDYICEQCYARVPLECSQLHVDWHEWLRRNIAALRVLADPPGA